MTFGPEPLWDAPLRLSGVALLACGGFLLAMVSSWLRGSARRFARTAGRVLTIVAVLWYLLVIESVRRFGIQWVSGRWDILSLRADITFLLAWLALSALAVAVVQRCRRNGV